MRLSTMGVAGSDTSTISTDTSEALDTNSLSPFRAATSAEVSPPSDVGQSGGVGADQLEDGVGG